MFDRKKILISFLILLLLVGGFFVWHKYFRLTPPEDWDSAETFSRETYNIKNTDEGRIVENEKAGITFKIPKGWEVREDKVSHNDFTLYSSNAVPGISTYLFDSLRKGCRINMKIKNINTNIETLKNYLTNKDQNSGENIEIDEIKEIRLDNKKAIKRAVKVASLKMEYTIFHIKYDNEIIIINLGSSLNNKQQCTEVFNEFVETISFK